MSSLQVVVRFPRLFCSLEEVVAGGRGGGDGGGGVVVVVVMTVGDMGGWVGVPVAPVGCVDVEKNSVAVAGSSIVVGGATVVIGGGGGGGVGVVKVPHLQ